MGTISYTVPQAGTDLNSVADPEIATALNTIKTWANGNVDSSNLNLATLVSVSGLLQLKYRSVSGNVTASAGDLCVITAGNPTVTLPAASANALVGIFVLNGAVSGASPVTVSGVHINGVGLSSATSFALGTPGAFAVLQSDGTNWFMIAGQQDTGWVALTLGGGVSSVGGYTPSARLQGDIVRTKGALNGTAITTWATIPAGLRPSGTVVYGPMFAIANLQIAASGAMTASSTGSAQTVGLDNLSFTLS